MTTRTTANGRQLDHEGLIGTFAYVTAFQGGDKSREVIPKVDQKTGIITLPESANGWDILSKLHDPAKIVELRKKTRNQLVSHFQLEVAHHEYDRIIVAQREQGDRYYLAPTVEPFGNMVIHTERPCEVNARVVSDKEMHEQGIPRLAIWTDTQMQDQRGSNRADIIRVSKEGRIAFNRILILYLDGQFRLVKDVGWRGYAYKRSLTSPFHLISDDKRIVAAYNNEEVSKLLNEFVFVPDSGHPSFEHWLQILLLPEFRELVRSAKLDEWDGDEKFWLKPTPKVSLTSDDQAVLDWFVYGTGGAAMGYATLRQPITFKGREITKVQLRHHTTDADRVNSQGLKLLRPGDILKVHRLVDMDNQGKQYSPLAVCSVLYSFREEAEEELEDEKVAA